MKLSIYCDVRSIGWIITKGTEVINKGIKRVNIDFDTYYEFIAGNAISKRISRREKRSARRNRVRRLSRKKHLHEILSKNAMLPNSEMMKSSKEFRLKLRVKALSQELNKQHLGLCLIELQKKRGYKSMRGTMAEGSDYLDAIKQHEENLKSYPSIAAYLLTLDSDKDVIFTRESYEAEFDKICQAQNLDKKLTEQLRKIIYFQRPLRKGAIANCPLERNRKVIHKSHPEFQEFRCYRDANNIMIVDPEMKDVAITKNLRQIWADKLLSGKSLTKASCCKDLGISKSTGYSWLSGKKLEGNSTSELSKYTTDEFGLWHDLYSATDENKLRDLLERKWKFNQVQIDELIDIDFKGMGWAEYSRKAIFKLKNHLKGGLKLKEAILNEYGKVEFSKDITLRNLLLEQVFESTKSLVSAIKGKYEIAEMQIELNHLLKAGNKIRKRISSGNRRNKKWEKENEQLISDNGGKPNQYNFHKLKLWEEWEGYSPYEPTKVIDLKELFTDEYNVDHIVPKSKIMERGMANQCLCRRVLNENKNRMTGIEFAKHLGIEEEYKALIEGLKLSDRKKKFLFMHTDEIPENYVSSGAGSDYNTRCFLTLHKNAICIPNKIVNRYYREWGYNLYGEDDARSSLMKAITLANFSKETVEYFDNLNEIQEGRTGLYNLQQELGNIDISDVNIYMPHIKLYRKINGKYSPRFQLHKETVYGYRPKTIRNAKGEEITEHWYKVRKPLTSLTKPMMDKIMDGHISKLVNKRFKECGTIEKFVESLEEKPLFHNGKAIKSVSIEVKSESVLPLHSTDGKGNTTKKGKHERKIDFVYSSMNALIGINKNGGKLTASPVPIMQYLDNLNNGNPHSYDFIFAKNTVIEKDGELFYLNGTAYPMEFRKLTQLNAEKCGKLSINGLKGVSIVSIDQLGEIKKRQLIC